MVYALSLNFFANVPTLYFKVYIVTCGRCEGDDIIGMDWRVIGYITFNFQTPPPARRPPPLLLEAAAAYYIIVSICQMMAMDVPRCAKFGCVFQNKWHFCGS